MTFGALETGFKFDALRWLSGAGGKQLVHPWSLFQKPNNVQELIQDTNYNIKHAGVKGYEKTSMQNEKTEEHRYRIEEMLRSLVAPVPRGRRIKSDQTIHPA